MRPRRVVFLGGNGHCAARLAAARAVLTRRDVDLVDIPYPGFEGRPRAADLETFLGSVAGEVAAAAAGEGRRFLYATGIGGLIALCLRAHGQAADAPLVLQAPVLWGLERRFMPRLMRSGPAQAAVRGVFASILFQRWFARQHFMKSPSPEMRTSFFDGYARCGALPDLFAWFTPALLRQLEGQLATRPAAVQNITVWWGGRDRVVTPRELRWTEDALETKWPVSVFTGWGHYPMIDEPEAWARAVDRHSTGA